ncbi:hypothetical protein ACFL48_04745 [Pseudomonadota bacterium]
MPKCKVEVLCDHFRDEIKSFISLDEDNQDRYSTPATGGLVGISPDQMYLLSEGVLFSAFRAYENFINELFLYYCIAEKTIGGQVATSYLNTRSKDKAYELVKSSQPFLDWASPDNVIQRSETYLKDGFLIKATYTAHKSTFRELHRLRNHIAHNSKESLGGYKKVLFENLSTLPVTIPSVGEYLLLEDKQNKPDHYLLRYLNFLDRMAVLLSS